MSAGKRARGGRRARRRAIELAIGVALAWLALAAAPASAHAADLFPVDDWIGDGLQAAKEVVLGGLEITAEAVARLLVTVVGAIADLLIPKSFVSEGLEGVRWLVTLPEIAAYNHVNQLRETLTWLGIMLLPVGLVVSGGRAMIAPTLGGDGLPEIVGRTVLAATLLALYGWVWAALSEASGLLTESVLGLPWVADGVERMLEALLIGGASGAAAVAEFVVLLVLLGVGFVVLALLVMKIGLIVGASVLYALGGIIVPLAPTQIGKRLLAAWAAAVAAVVVLPILWSLIFAVGAALMLDADGAGGGAGFQALVAQLFNLAAAFATFFLAFKLGFAAIKAAGGLLQRSAPGLSSAAGAPPVGRAASASAGASGPGGVASFGTRIRAGLAASGPAGVAVAAATQRRPGRSGTPAQSTAQPAERHRRAAEQPPPRSSAEGELVGQAPDRSVQPPRPRRGAPGRGEAPTGPRPSMPPPAKERRAPGPGAPQQGAPSSSPRPSTPAPPARPPLDNRPRRGGTSPTRRKEGDDE